MSPETKKRRTRRVRKVKSSRKSSAKASKRKNTLEQHLSQISKLINSKKRFSTQEMLGKLGEESQKKTADEDETALIKSFGQKLDDEKEMLNNLGRELKKLRKSRISKINTQNKKKARSRTLP